MDRRDGLAEMAPSMRGPQVHDASTGRFRHQPWGPCASLVALHQASKRSTMPRKSEHAMPGRAKLSDAFTPRLLQAALVPLSAACSRADMRHSLRAAAPDTPSVIVVPKRRR